jgi:hypothetical protein
VTGPRAAPAGRFAFAAVAVLAPALALAGDAASTKDLVLDFERSGVLKDLLGKTLTVAKSFLFLSTFLGYAIEAFGKSPLAGRDYAAVTWRVILVLLLLWNYQTVFGGVIELLDGLERQVAPPSTWKAFVEEAGEMRQALEEVASSGERPAGAEGTAASVASKPSGITAWAYDALIACIQLVAEAAVFLVNWISRILTATLFVIGPLALVAGIPRVSSTATRWFVRFVTIASWPVFSGVLLSVLVTLGAQGAVRRTYLECLVAALVMLVTALATPLLASHVIGGALDNAASRGWGSAKAAHHDAVRPALRLAGGAAGRVVAAGTAAAHAVAGGSASGGPGGGNGGPSGGNGGPSGGGGAAPPRGGGSGGAMSNPPGGGARLRGGGRRGRGGAKPKLPAASVPAAPTGAAEQGGVVANPPAPAESGRPVPTAPADGAKPGSKGGR